MATFLFLDDFDPHKDSNIITEEGGMRYLRRNSNFSGCNPTTLERVHAHVSTALLDSSWGTKSVNELQNALQNVKTLNDRFAKHNARLEQITGLCRWILSWFGVQALTALPTANIEQALRIKTGAPPGPVRHASSPPSVAAPAGLTIPPPPCAIAIEIVKCPAGSVTSAYITTTLKGDLESYSRMDFLDFYLKFHPKKSVTCHSSCRPPYEQYGYETVPVLALRWSKQNGFYILSKIFDRDYIQPDSSLNGVRLDNALYFKEGENLLVCGGYEIKITANRNNAPPAVPLASASPTFSFSLAQSTLPKDDRDPPARDFFFGLPPAPPSAPPSTYVPAAAAVVGQTIAATPYTVNVEFVEFSEYAFGAETAAKKISEWMERASRSEQSSIYLKFHPSNGITCDSTKPLEQKYGFELVPVLEMRWDTKWGFRIPNRLDDRQPEFLWDNKRYSEFSGPSFNEGENFLGCGKYKLKITLTKNK